MFVTAEPTPFPGMDRDYVAEMGVAAMALKSRRDLLCVHDGGRRILGERTPGRATLTLVKKENC